MRSLAAILLCSVLIGSTKGLLDVGECPEFSNIETFDVAPYMGRWFEIERFENGFAVGLTCITVDYGYLSDTAMTLTEAANNPEGNIDVIEGNATTTSNPGQIIAFYPGNSPGVYNVLDTDYETYSCLYSCEQVGEYREQLAWIASRTEELDADTLAAARAVFESNGIDISFFQATLQGGDCIYVQAPPPPVKKDE